MHKDRAKEADNIDRILREVLSSIPLKLKAILYIKVLKINEKMQIVMSWKIMVLNKLSKALGPLNCISSIMCGL